MFQTLVNSLFGCSHRRTTFPLTPGRNSSTFHLSQASRSGTYVVCLDCGKEFSYDWNRMQVGRPMTIAPAAAQVQPQYR